MTGRRRSVTVPVFFYVAVALGVPVLRGAASHRGFLPHAATVLLVVAAVSAAWAGTRPARP